MADITGYILDSSLAGFVYDLSIYGAVATFSVSGVSMDYVNTELEKRLKEASLGTSFIWTNGIVDVSSGTGGDITGSGVQGKFAIWDGTKILTYENLINWDGSTVRIGAIVAVDPNNPSRFRVHQTHPTSYNIAAFTSDIDSYSQIRVHNDNVGTQASGDVVIEADNATESTNYVDLGINNSQYGSGFVGNANDAYLYNAGQNLLIGNITAGKDIIFFSGGSDVYNNERFKITSDGKIFIGKPTSQIYNIEANGDINVPLGNTYRIGGQDIGIVDVQKAYVDEQDALRVKEASIGTGFAWVAGKLNVDVSAASGGVSQSYVDVSLLARDTHINDVSSRLYSTDLKNASQDTSILNATIKNTNQDTSILSIWTKLGSVDTSLLNLGSKNTFQDTSIYNLGVKNAAQDTSILSIWTKFGSVDTSLLNLGAKNTYQDTSIAGAYINFGHYIKSASIGDHLAFTAGILNVTIDEDNFAKITYVDGSLARIKAQYIPDVSLNQSKFKWVGGYLEPSTAGGSGLDRPAIDASYAIKSGFNTIFVSASQPTNPATGDLWINIS